jgi:hypothetical protein
MKIEIQSTRGRESFTFPDGTKVAEAVKEAVRAFNFPAVHHYGLLLSGNTSTPLDTDRTLTSYNIRDGAVLFLTITLC